MIRYSLICDNTHEFESWFADSASFDTQAKRGFVECPFCHSKKVSKALMTPAVSTRGRKSAMRDDQPAAATAETPHPVALLDAKQQQMRAMIRELHNKLTENSTDVGSNFPAEARKMHDGDEPKRSIHGQATFAEAKALAEEGIPVLPLPGLPEEAN